MAEAHRLRIVSRRRVLAAGAVGLPLIAGGLTWRWWAMADSDATSQVRSGVRRRETRRTLDPARFTGKAAADFATSNVIGSPGSLIAGMWNHGPLMEASAQKQGVAWPVLQGRDLADLGAYLGSLRPRPSAPAAK